MLKLVSPTLEFIDSYLEAKKQGFIDMQLGFAQDTYDNIVKSPETHIDSLKSKDPFTLKLNETDYTVYDHELLWITDGKQFIGSMALRYKSDPTLENEYSGHRGLAIHPELRGKGYGKQAWLDTFDTMKSKFLDKGIHTINITVDIDNIPSQKLVTNTGGAELIKTLPDTFGDGESYLYQIHF